MKTNIVIDISPEILEIWQNSGSQVMGQNAVNQSNSRTL